jgi:hypothetical protein
MLLGTQFNLSGPRDINPYNYRISDDCNDMNFCSKSGQFGQRGARQPLHVRLLLGFYHAGGLCTSKLSSN